MHGRVSGLHILHFHSVSSLTYLQNILFQPSLSQSGLYLLTSTTWHLSSWISKSNPTMQLVSYLCLKNSSHASNPKLPWNSMRTIILESPTVQNMFGQSILALISCTGVNRRWRWLPHVQSTVRWLALASRLQDDLVIMYILVTHVKVLLIINGYMYTCKTVTSSACMKESAAAMTVFNSYCSWRS